MMLCHYEVMQTNKLNSAHWHYEDTFSVNFFFAHAETQSILLSLFYYPDRQCVLNTQDIRWNVVSLIQLFKVLVQLLQCHRTPLLESLQKLNALSIDWFREGKTNSSFFSPFSIEPLE